MAAFLFVTDLDNTLIGDDKSLSILNQKLNDHRQQYGSKIVYATGRSLYLYQELILEKTLLSPDALITSVGTEIYFNPNQNHFDREWAKILSSRWNREEIYTIASRFPELVPQPQSEQGAFKLSYYLTPKDAINILPKLELSLINKKFKPKLIYSGSKDLDIVPEKSDKGLALQFLRQRWAIEAIKTVVCGDSGNDIALFQRDERGIIVGNAQNELRQWYENNQTAYRYFAQKNYAAGILEGLEYFQFL